MQDQIEATFYLWVGSFINIYIKHEVSWEMIVYEWVIIGMVLYIKVILCVLNYVESSRGM